MENVPQIKMQADVLTTRVTSDVVMYVITFLPDLTSCSSTMHIKFFLTSHKQWASKTDGLGTATHLITPQCDLGQCWHEEMQLAKMNPLLMKTKVLP